MKRKAAHKPDSTTTHEGPAQDAVEPSSNKKKRTKLNRRQFLVGGTGAAAAVIMTRKSLASPQHDEHSQGKATRVRQITLSTPFAQPPVITSNGGVINVPLVVSMIGGTQQIRAYNGNVPGPTIKVKAGDRLGIRLFNQLPANPGGLLDFYGKPNEMSNPHGFNSTNLHTHGLHVSPLSFDPCAQRPAGPGNAVQNGPVGSGCSLVASDDVLIEVKPGQMQQYCIEIPSFHAPGTHWYHAHKHGSTAMQLAQGLAGVLIVDEPAGQQILAAGANDYVWLIQEVLTNNDAQAIYTTTLPATQFNINGQFQPTLTMMAGEVQRWRIVNGTGTPRGLCQLVLKSSSGTAQTMRQVATDGISFYGKKPQPLTALNMGAGNRADVLVKLTAGTYTLVRNDYPWIGGGGIALTQVLATIVVLPSPLNDPLPIAIPGASPGYLLPISSLSAPSVSATFGTIQPGAWTSACGNSTQPASHPTQVPFPPPANNKVNIMPGLSVINCKEYMPPPNSGAGPGTWDMFQPTLNTTQQWVLSNLAGSAHPFHIHVNPFQVEHFLIDPSLPDSPNNWMWMDTIPIPPPGVSSPPPWFQNNKVTIRTRYSDFYGRFVLHCHILVHEDLGLMANVYVKDDPTHPGTGPCLKI